MILNFLAIFIGGGLGALLRYVTGILCSRHVSCSFPVSTFAVNIIACFIIGFAVAFFLNRTDLNHTYKLAITIGFCGGLSTVSTFSVEVINMLDKSNYLLALLYVSLSIIVCLCATFIGIKLGGH